MYIHEKCVCGRLAFFGVFRAMVTRQVAANVVPFLLKEIEKKSKQKWLFLNVLYNLPCSGYSVDQSINKFISRHSTEASATVRLCPIKEKCLETDLKCVNGWRNSTVQWKRVPKSRRFWHRRCFSFHELLRVEPCILFVDSDLGLSNAEKCVISWCCR